MNSTENLQSQWKASLPSQHMTTSLKYSSTLISAKESLGNNFVTKLPVTESSHDLSFRMDPVSFSSGPGFSYESQSFL